MTIGQRIAQKRRELSLSQEALGAELGVSRQAIYKWESDAAVPEIDKLITLSRRFGVSVGWLLGVEDLETPPSGEESANPGALTEEQLKLVEEIVGRYTAALPKPLSRRRRLLLKLSVAVAAVCLVGVLWSLRTRLERMEQQYSSLQTSVSGVKESVNSQIGSISSQVESILKSQNELTADYGTELLSGDLGKNQVTFSLRAVPRTYTQGMTAAFLADCGDGSPVSVPGHLGEDGAFTASLTCPLTDSMDLSVVFVLPDGTRQTQLLDQYYSLYSATLPVVELMSYETGELLGRKAEENGRVELPEVYVDASPGIPYVDSKEPLDQAQVQTVRVGLFLDKALVTWLEPCEVPSRMVQGDIEDHSFFHLPQGVSVTLAEHTQELCFAAVVTDEYGREAVYNDIPYILENGALTWPSGSASDTDPTHWEYDA